MTYKEKLLDPRWQKKRLEILDRDNFCCQNCFDETKTLHVHHRNYIQGIEPWDYDNSDLVTLCDICHDQETELIKIASIRLINIVRRKFFALQIDEMAASFEQYECAFNNHVDASAISYFISNPEILKIVIEKYFEHLSIKTGKVYYF